MSEVIKKGPGGERPGAGRPRVSPDSIRCTVTLRQDQIDAALIAGEGNASKGLRTLLDRLKVLELRGASPARAAMPPPIPPAEPEKKKRTVAAPKI